MNRGDRVFVAGSGTSLGKTLLGRLEQMGCHVVPGADAPEPDLTDPAQVNAFFGQHRPEFVFMVAGETGGIGANQDNPADLMLDNLLTECHVIRSAHDHGAKKLVYLASSCCYPRDCPQPMRVEDLFSGPLEPTNDAYATAKLAGIKMCQAYRQQYGDNFVVAIPANPFGPGEDFSLERSHVIPALINKMDSAKTNGTRTVEIWGTGRAQREFLYGDDLADACIFLMQHFDGAEPINIGSGAALAISDLAHLLQTVVGFDGDLYFNHGKPDGAPVKILDSTPIQELGWRPKTTVSEGIAATYRWFLDNKAVSGDLSISAQRD
ncbi:MAG: GDP-L-fucose synthase [Chloroflexi bacterium]|nr:GDP-L-fucose synthase [Chloroflexota bacterium]